MAGRSEDESEAGPGTKARVRRGQGVEFPISGRYFHHDNGHISNWGSARECVGSREYAIDDGVGAVLNNQRRAIAR